jgi:hypothetical protein
MDPRTGSFGESRQPKRPVGEKPGAKTGKLKSVTLMVEWGYEIHSVTIGPWTMMKPRRRNAAGRTSVRRIAQVPMKASPMSA